MPGLPVGAGFAVGGSGYLLGQVTKAGRDVCLTAIAPWIARRNNIEANANIVRTAEARRLEKLIDEKTKADVKALRAGNAALNSNNELVYFHDESQHPLMLPPGESLGEIIKLAQTQDALDSAERFLALRQIARLAEEEAARLDRPAKFDKPIESGWLRQFSVAASNSPDDETLRAIWAKLLVAEADSPGSQSVRTINTLSLLSSDEARIFADLAPLVIDFTFFLREDGIVQLPGMNFPAGAAVGFSGDSFLTDRGLTYDKMMLLENAGLITYDSFYYLDIPVLEWDNRIWYKFSFHNKHLLLVRSPTIKGPARLPSGNITPEGQAILRLGDFQGDRSYMSILADHMKLYNPDRIEIVPVILEKNVFASAGSSEVLFTRLNNENEGN
ncbi:DUF2806 domain-containing protein [Acidisoma cellulosilytica]|uniref:DUF2806 domain-containing protein n=1 Tax=Acidisoma cellulosilyticum TaxID=2802395 RepID=A0A964E3Q3_9PROT|nr:DUF2806 domain-containing protein [Acidisoma cellulosilyticum]MCB8880188.1 DUF2806 domain-containing protein [Acidisoma cellulosilyticum]